MRRVRVNEHLRPKTREERPKTREITGLQDSKDATVRPRNQERSPRKLGRPVDPIETLIKDVENFIGQRKKQIDDYKDFTAQVMEKLKSLKPVQAPTSFWQSMMAIDQYEMNRQAESALVKARAVIEEHEEHHRQLDKEISSSEPAMGPDPEFLDLMNPLEKARLTMKTAKVITTNAGATNAAAALVVTENPIEANKRRVKQLLEMQEQSEKQTEKALESLLGWFNLYDPKSMDYTYFTEEIQNIAESYEGDALDPKWLDQEVVAVDRKLARMKDGQRQRLDDLIDIHRLTFDEIDKYHPDRFRELQQIVKMLQKELRTQKDNVRELSDNLRSMEKNEWLHSKLMEKRNDQIKLLMTKMERERVKFLDFLKKRDIHLDTTELKMLSDGFDDMEVKEIKESEEVDEIKKIYEMEEEIRDLRTKMANLDARSSAITRHLLQAEDHIETLEAHEKELIADCEKLEDENEDLCSQLEQTTKDLEESKEESRRHASALIQARAEIDQLKAEIESLENAAAAAAAAAAVPAVVPPAPSVGQKGGVGSDKTVSKGKGKSSIGSVSALAKTGLKSSLSTSTSTSKSGGKSSGGGVEKATVQEGAQNSAASASASAAAAAPEISISAPPPSIGVSENSGSDNEQQLPNAEISDEAQGASSVTTIIKRQRRSNHLAPPPAYIRPSPDGEDGPVLTPEQQLAQKLENFDPEFMDRKMAGRYERAHAKKGGFEGTKKEQVARFMAMLYKRSILFKKALHRSAADQMQMHDTLVTLQHELDITRADHEALKDRSRAAVEDLRTEFYDVLLTGIVNRLSRMFLSNLKGTDAWEESLLSQHEKEQLELDRKYFRQQISEILENHRKGLTEKHAGRIQLDGTSSVERAADLAREVKDKDVQLKKLRLENNNLKQSLAQVHKVTINGAQDAVMTQLDEKARALERELETVKAQAQSANSSAEMQRKILQDELVVKQTLQKSLETSEKKVSELTNEIETAKKALSSANIQSADLELQKSALTVKMKEMEGKITKFTALQSKHQSAMDAAQVQLQQALKSTLPTGTAIVQTSDLRSMHGCVLDTMDFMLASLNMPMDSRKDRLFGDPNEVLKIDMRYLKQIRRFAKVCKLVPDPTKQTEEEEGQTDDDALGFGPITQLGGGCSNPTAQGTTDGQQQAEASLEQQMREKDQTIQTLQAQIESQKQQIRTLSFTLPPSSAADRKSGTSSSPPSPPPPLKPINTAPPAFFGHSPPSAEHNNAQLGVHPASGGKSGPSAAVAAEFGTSVASTPPSRSESPLPISDYQSVSGNSKKGNKQQQQQQGGGATAAATVGGGDAEAQGAGAVLALVAPPTVDASSLVAMSALKTDVVEQLEKDKMKLKMENEELAEQVRRMALILESQDTSFRQQAMELLEKDRDLQEKKVSAHFQTLAAGLKLQKVRDKIERAVQKNKPAKEILALERMSQQHERRMLKWKKRKEQILLERAKVFENMCHLVSNFMTDTQPIRTTLDGYMTPSKRSLTTVHSIILPAPSPGGAPPIPLPTSPSGAHFAYYTHLYANHEVGALVPLKRRNSSPPPPLPLPLLDRSVSVAGTSLDDSDLEVRGAHAASRTSSPPAVVRHLPKRPATSMDVTTSPLVRKIRTPAAQFRLPSASDQPAYKWTSSVRTAGKNPQHPQKGSGKKQQQKSVSLLSPESPDGLFGGEDEEIVILAQEQDSARSHGHGGGVNTDELAVSFSFVNVAPWSRLQTPRGGSSEDAAPTLSPPPPPPLAGSGGAQSVGDLTVTSSSLGGTNRPATRAAPPRSGSPSGGKEPPLSPGVLGFVSLEQYLENQSPLTLVAHSVGKPPLARSASPMPSGGSGASSLEPPKIVERSSIDGYPSLSASHLRPKSRGAALVGSGARGMVGKSVGSLPSPGTNYGVLMGDTDGGGGPPKKSNVPSLPHLKN